MRVLLIKTTSMGDVIHALPALTDAAAVIPGIRFDWVVEQPFSEVPAWHANVDKTIPVALRKWRKNIWNTYRSGEWRHFKKVLKNTKYDKVIDAQGLLKSAWLTRYVSTETSSEIYGLDKHSAREALASSFYDHKISVPKNQHAVERVRQLFASALSYDLPDTQCDYGIDPGKLPCVDERGYVVFLHGTTWATKHWPEPYWFELADLMKKAGIKVKVPWGNEVERQRAERIAKKNDNVEVLPKLNLNDLGGYILNARGVVSVDTGLAHLAAALSVPNITLYGPTDPALVGTHGAGQIHLQSTSYKLSSDNKREEIEPEIFATLTPDIVWETLMKQLKLGG